MFPATPFFNGSWRPLIMRTGTLHRFSSASGMNGSPPEIIISISGSSALCPTSGISAQNLSGYSSPSRNVPNPPWEMPGEDDPAVVDLDALADVVHHVEHVLLGCAVVAAAAAAAER